MHGVYLFSVWLHIMAAVVWIGGTIFLAAVLVPAIRRPEIGAIASLLIRVTAYRFRWIGWVCFAVFFLTGAFNLSYRGIGFEELAFSDLWLSPFGLTLGIKLVLVTMTVALSVLHDFVIGPQATESWERDPDSPQTRRLRHQAVQLARINLLLAVLIAFLGVMLVRGQPW
jgi:uncharacterized membrane protein